MTPKLADLERNVEGLEKSLAFLQDSLVSAQENHEVAEQKISHQNEKIRELEKLLDEEREKTQCLRDILEGDVQGPQESASDPQQTFGTVSTALMQYK